ncbi:MAG: hypothetical protein Q8O19_01330, partial [Rectinemataceae bacterium]|nr:hypothetical protein [Rectinemataceae bacterium]
WLRRSLNSIYTNLFSKMVTPKKQELIASPFRFDGDQQKAEYHFISGLTQVFKNIYSQHNHQYPVTIFYAFKQTEKEGNAEENNLLIASTGWETMLDSLTCLSAKLVCRIGC